VSLRDSLSASHIFRWTQRSGPLTSASFLRRKDGNWAFALSPGERVSRDGALSSRRGTGEGLLPYALHVIRLRLRLGCSPPLRAAYPLRRRQAEA
jgi:hypothetical protein